MPKIRLTRCYQRQSEIVRPFNVGQEAGFIALLYFEIAPYDGIFYINAETNHNGEDPTFSAHISGNPKDLMDVMWSQDMVWALEKAKEDTDE